MKIFRNKFSRSSFISCSRRREEADSWSFRRTPPPHVGGYGFRHTSESSYNQHQAFTMIEIAIALAVIAFALVAIIGVLPVGLTVQKDNREETIMNQDGPYWLEAIRNGAQGFDNLTNYVERIGVVLIDLNLNPNTISTNFSDYDPPANKHGSNVVGLLSLPKNSFYFDGSKTQLVVRVEAQTRALTGAATEQGLANKDFSFSYLLVSEIIPFDNIALDSTNYLAYLNRTPPVDPSEWITRSNRWAQVPFLEAHTREVRLNFRWPFISPGKTGSNRQLFRALVAGRLLPSPGDPHLYFFQPQTYAK